MTTARKSSEDGIALIMVMLLIMLGVILFVVGCLVGVAWLIRG